MTDKEFWLGVLYTLLSQAWPVCLGGLALILMAVPTDDVALFKNGLPLFLGGLAIGIGNRALLGCYR